MKSLSFSRNYLKKYMIAVVLFVGNFLAFAQDATHAETTDGAGTTTTTTTESWYANPIYLAIGALVLIILIALFARGSRRS